MNYNKYGNRKTEIDGITFSSIKESEYYLKLKALLKVRKIKNLKMQPKYLLQRGFIDFAKQPHRPIYYIADFEYKIGDKTWVVDVKSSLTFQTEVYKIKKKLFLFKYRDYIFEEIY